MIPAITDIRRSLSNCRTSLERLADVKPVAGEAVVRNTMFAEFPVEWQGGRWLLCTPLSERAADVVEAMGRMVVRLRTARPGHVAEYRVFHSELQFFDSIGRVHRCDVVMQRLPDGRPLSRCACVVSHEQLEAELDSMQAEFARIGFAHNNLKPENIIVTPDERLVVVRCNFARMGEEADTSAGGNDGRAFEQLHAYVKNKPLADESLVDESATATNRRVTTVEDGCEVAGIECEQRILIRRDGLYGYADPQGRVVIEPQFDAAESFREGRAEVEMNGRMGLIDKSGRWVIQPQYDDLQYFDGGGLSLLHADGEWSVADYDGNPTGIHGRDVEQVYRMIHERIKVKIDK